MLHDHENQADIVCGLGSPELGLENPGFAVASSHEEAARPSCRPGYNQFCSLAKAAAAIKGICRHMAQCTPIPEDSQEQKGFQYASGNEPVAGALSSMSEHLLRFPDNAGHLPLEAFSVISPLFCSIYVCRRLIIGR